MAGDPGSIPPDFPPPPPEPSEKKPKGGAQFAFTEGHKFLGMYFEAKDWNKLMNIFFQGLGDFINKTFQKMTEKLKEDWKRGEGEDTNSS